jgi:hypothetical protein
MKITSLTISLEENKKYIKILDELSIIFIFHGLPCSVAHLTFLSKLEDGEQHRGEYLNHAHAQDSDTNL